MKNINIILNDYFSITNLSRAVQNLLLSTPSPSIFPHGIYQIFHQRVVQVKYDGKENEKHKYHIERLLLNN